MSAFLDKLLARLEAQLPETNGHWISDLRTEAAHIPAGLTRIRFQGNGVLTAFGELLHVRIGPQKMGQCLLGGALLLLCLGGLIFAAGIVQDFVRTTFYCVLPIYSLAGFLAFLNLSWMKRFTLFAGLIFCAAWSMLGTGLFSVGEAPIVFLRAFILEAAFMMAGLFVAASYLSWLDGVEHA